MGRLADNATRQISPNRKLQGGRFSKARPAAFHAPRDQES
jgi:hypothetical protein